MKMNFGKTLFVLCMLGITSCSGPETQKKVLAEPITVDTPVSPPPAPKELLKNFKEEDVAKYAVATIMGRSESGMSCKKKEDVYVVSYIRQDDRQKFEYEIMINDDRILWRIPSGRWRDEDRISFEEDGKYLRIIQTFSDGSVSMKEFKRR